MSDEMEIMTAKVTAASRVAARLGRKPKTAKEAVVEKKQAEQQRVKPPPAPMPTEPTPTPVMVPHTPLSRTVTPPAKWEKSDRPMIFLDGGLGKAENWQAQVYDSVKRLGLQILNPKRWDDQRLKLKQEITEQIRWEQKAGEEAELFVFWFTAGWHFPLAMYRLGQAMVRRRKVFVGAHPDSPVLVEIEAQMENYGQKVYQNLNVLCQDLIEAIKNV